ncbi:MAG: TRAP transporter large permease subunit [Pseudomonadota bacterium]
MEALAPYLPFLMFASLAVLLFSGFPVAFILGGVGLSFALIAIAVDPWLFDWPQLGAPSSRIFGIQENLILTAIPMFIFMGTMLERSGIARDLLNCLQVLLRRVPGGLALAVTLMGTILAATTGIIGASVVMMSLLALPVMLERGYDPRLATGTIAASGTLGILIPPSIMLVLMADLLSVSVGNLFVAAVIPGFMLSGMYMIYIYILARIRPAMAPPLSDDIGPKTQVAYWALVLRSFVPPVILIVLVLGSILGGFATPTEAAGVGAAGAILLALLNLVIVPTVGFIWIAPIYAGIALWVIAAAIYGILSGFGLNPFGAVAAPAFWTGVITTVLGYLWSINFRRNDGDMSQFDQVDFSLSKENVDLGDRAVGGGFAAEFAHFWSSLKDVLMRTALTNAMIFGIFVGATLFSFVFRAIGGEEQVLHLVDSLGLGSWGLLLILMALVFLLGFFLDFIEIMLIVLPVFAPIIKLLEFGDHVMQQELIYWFAILLAVNLQTSFLTPPFGFALFYMKGVAPKSIKIQQIYQGIIPFVVLQVIAVLLVMGFPELALWLPRTLLD